MTDDLPPPSEHQVAADALGAKVLLRAEAAGLTLSREIRREALALIRKLVKDGRLPHQILPEFLQEFRAILRKYEAPLARVLTDSQLAAFLQGGQGVYRSLPPVNHDSLEAILEQLKPGNALGPPEWTKRVTMEGESAPIASFPIIDAAAADLAKGGLLSSPDLYELGQQARQEGFLTGRTTALDAYEKVRDALIDAVVNGDSEATFQAKVGDALEKSRLDPGKSGKPGKQSMIFRNVVMRAYARGQRAVVENPLVRSVAVFAWRVEIEDSRLTDLCRCLSHSGLENVQGKRTSFYCVDDPVWRIVAPTSHVGCRCSTIFMTIKRAAEKGIKVAQKWLATGIRPSDEELFVPMPDLSMVPASERKQFENWVSPWAQDSTVSLSAKDASGHLHKGKGEGGGQFTGEGTDAAAKTPAQSVRAKIQSGEIFSSASLKNACGGTGQDRSEWLGQVASDLSVAFAAGTSTTVKIQAIQSRLTEQGAAPRHPGWHKAEKLIQRFSEEFADGGGTPQDIADTVNYARGVTESMTPEQQAHVAKELGLSIQPSGGFPDLAFKFENGDFKQVPGAELTYAGTTAAGKDAFRDGSGQYYVRGSNGRTESVSSGFDPARTIANPVNGQSVVEGIRRKLSNAKAEQAEKARVEQEDRERLARVEFLRNADIAPFPPEAMPEAGNRPPARAPEFVDKRTEQDPWEWDGEIDQDNIDRGSIETEEHIADWNFRDDGDRNFAQTVSLETAYYDPNPDDDDVEKVIIYRWESAQDGAGGTDRGDWTADRAEAIAAGKEFARSSNQEDEPEEEEDDEEDNSDQEIRDLFGADELGLRVEQDRNTVRLYHSKIDQCKRTLGVDGDGEKFIHNDIFEVVEAEQGKGFGKKVFAAEVEGAAAAGYSYIETHAARDDGTYNGYYTWVMLGYDAPVYDLSRKVIDLVQKIAPDAESVQDVIAMDRVDIHGDDRDDLREKLLAIAKKTGNEKIAARIREKAAQQTFSGADWWLAYGEGLRHAKFDLSDGSRSRRKLAHAMRSKR